MTTTIRSTVRAVTLLLLTFFLARCSLFGSGAHRHSSVTRGDDLRPAIPSSDSDLADRVPGQLVVRLHGGTSLDDIAEELGAEIVDTLPSLNAALLWLPAGMPVVKASLRSITYPRTPITPWWSRLGRDTTPLSQRVGRLSLRGGSPPPFRPSCFLPRSECLHPGSFPWSPLS